MYLYTYMHCVKRHSMGFTWRSHYVLYFIPPLLCTIMPYSHKFTPTFSEMASHPLPPTHLPTLHAFTHT